jgi:hypothetical protein
MHRDISWSFYLGDFISSFVCLILPDTAILATKPTFQSITSLEIVTITRFSICLAVKPENLGDLSEMKPRNYANYAFA